MLLYFRLKRIETFDNNGYCFRKALEQREKEAEIFYKSESSEEETEKEEVVQSAKEITPSTSENCAQSTICKSSKENPPETNVTLSLTNEEKPSKVEARETLAQTGKNNEHCTKVTLNEGKCHEQSTENHQDTIVTENANEAHNLETSEKTHENNSENLTETTEGFSTTVDEESSVKENLEQEEIKLTSPKKLTKDDSTSDIKRISGNTENFSLSLSVSHSEDDSFSNLTEKITTEDSEPAKISTMEIPNQELINDKNCSENISISNTEDFSLRMSESQSENILNSTADELVLSNHSKERESEICSDIKENVIDSLVVRGDEEKMDVDSDFTETEVDRNEKVVGETSSLGEKSSDSIVESIEQKLKDKYNFEPKQRIVGLKMKKPSGGMINFEDEGFKPGVNELFSRFQMHMSYKKKPTKKKTQLELRSVLTS